MNLFKYLFGRRDWYPVWSAHGEWIVTARYFDRPNDNFEKKAMYEIFYSPSRQRYKLICSGYKPKEHDDYVEAVNKLNELINKKA